MLKSSIFLLLILSFFGCTFNSEEDLYGTNCDTTVINYGIVQPIFEANCVVCHNNGLNYNDILLNSYANAINAAQTGKLVKAINHLSGATPMPYLGSKLPNCPVLQVTLWIEQGTPQ